VARHPLADDGLGLLGLSNPNGAWRPSTPTQPAIFLMLGEYPAQSAAVAAGSPRRCAAAPADHGVSALLHFRCGPRRRCSHAPITHRRLRPRLPRAVGQVSSPMADAANKNNEKDLLVNKDAAWDRSMVSSASLPRCVRTHGPPPVSSPYLWPQVVPPPPTPPHKKILKKNFFCQTQFCVKQSQPSTHKRSGASLATFSSGM